MKPDSSKHLVHVQIIIRGFFSPVTQKYSYNLAVWGKQGWGTSVYNLDLFRTEDYFKFWMK